MDTILRSIFTRPEPAILAFCAIALGAAVLKSGVLNLL